MNALDLDPANASFVDLDGSRVKVSAVFSRRRKICFICTQSFAMRTLYKGLFPFFEGKNFNVHAVSGDDEFADFSATYFGNPQFDVIPMKRFPKIWDDLGSFYKFVVFFRKNKFDIIHVSTPKASLLVSVAAKLAGNGPVVFVYRRCVYQHMTGLKQSILKAVDKFICWRSDYVLAISKQLRDYLVNEAISPSRKTSLIGEGSSNGIDTEFFRSTEAIQVAGRRLRAELRITDDAPVILYLGRILREKGVDFLPPILERVKRDVPNAVLVAAGPDESARDPISAETRAYLKSSPDVRFLDFVPDPRPLFEMADVFCFPSFFEGYGNVMLEAAAMSVPAVGFAVPGVEEAVAHNRSGLLSDFGDLEAMSKNIVDILSDDALRERLRRDGLIRINTAFSQPAFFAKLYDVLENVIAARK